MLSIKWKNKEREIGFSYIMQLCGQNTIDKNKVIETIRKYFSSEKYQEHEQVNLALISVDGEEYGRKAFTVNYIHDICDIISAIKLTKTSMMTCLLKQLISEFDCQKVMEEIDNRLITVTNILNQELRSIGEIELDYEPNDIWEIVQKTELKSTEAEGYIENKSPYELLEIYLNMLVKLQSYTPTRSLVILKDLDHLVCHVDYLALMKKISDIAERYDIRFIISTSLSGYIYPTIENMTGITVFNESTYVFPPVDRIMEYIVNNYPIEKSFSEKRMLEIVATIAQQIGSIRRMDFEENVVLAMINNSLMVTPRKEFGNPFMPEIVFLNQV